MEHQPALVVLKHVEHVSAVRRVHQNVTSMMSVRKIGCYASPLRRGPIIVVLVNAYHVKLSVSKRIASGGSVDDKLDVQAIRIMVDRKPRGPFEDDSLGRSGTNEELPHDVTFV